MRKVLFTLMFALVCHALAAESLEGVGYASVELPNENGDWIKIDQVKSSGSFDVGDTIVVSGSYQLTSRERAQIAVFITQTEGDGKSEVLPGQTLTISHGQGQFRLSLYIRHKGWPHVSLYPANGGSSFASTYFGNRKQVDAATDSFKRH